MGTTPRTQGKLLPGPDVVRTELVEIQMDTDRRMRDECYRVLQDEGGLGNSVKTTASPVQLSYLKRRAMDLCDSRDKEYVAINEIFSVREAERYNLYLAKM